MQSNQQRNCIKESTSFSLPCGLQFHISTSSPESSLLFNKSKATRLRNSQPKTLLTSTTDQFFGSERKADYKPLFFNLSGLISSVEEKVWLISKFDLTASKMFARLRGKPKQQSDALTTLDKLNETLEMLEKKENLLQKKASAEVEKAKTYTKAKNKRAAIQCLKRKKLYEEQIGQLGNFQLRIHDQMIMLEGAKATTDTVDALRSGAAAMKAMQKATNIDDVDKTMDDINEQTENMKQIQEALATPVGAAADFDEDELEAELEELEGLELEEELLQPTTTAPSAPVQVPTGRVHTRPPPQKRTEEEDELAALQAEMAL